MQEALQGIKGGLNPLSQMIRQTAGIEHWWGAVGEPSRTSAGLSFLCDELRSGPRHVLPRVEEFAGFPFYREISSRFGSVEQTHSAAREKAWNELAKLKRQAAALELNGRGTLREGIPQEEVIRVAANVKPDLNSAGIPRL